MGLDNAVYLGLDQPIPEDVLERYYERSLPTVSVEKNVDGTLTYWYDISYWRKCWGIRDDILKYFKDNYNVDEDDINNFYTSDIKIIKAIQDINYYYLHPDNWTEDTSQVWNWMQYSYNLVDNMIRLENTRIFIMNWLSNDIPELEGIKPYWKFCFVDSY